MYHFLMNHKSELFAAPHVSLLELLLTSRMQVKLLALTASRTLDGDRQLDQVTGSEDPKKDRCRINIGGIVIELRAAGTPGAGPGTEIPGAVGG